MATLYKMPDNSPCSLKLETPVGKCASEEGARYMTDEAVICPDGNGGAFLCATEGHVLAIVQLEGTPPAERGFVPGNILKKPGVIERDEDEQWKHVAKQGRKELVTLGGNLEEGRYPPVSLVLKDTANGNGEGVVMLGLQVRHLLYLAEAITKKEKNDDGELYVELIFATKEGKPDFTKPIGVVGKDGIGVAMPTTVRKESAEKFVKQRNAFIEAMGEESLVYESRSSVEARREEDKKKGKK